MIRSIAAMPVAIAYLLLKCVGDMAWSVFGNNDDPKPPESFRSEWPEWRRLFVWYVTRNPLHNLFFYRIGVKGKGWRVIGRFPSGSPSGVEMWPPSPYRMAWCYHEHPSLPWLRLPFVSWRIPMFGRGLEGYIGWRPSGSFGGSLRLKESTAA